jgi:hypothetical protein
MHERTYKYMFLTLFLSMKGQKNPQINKPLLVGYSICGGGIIGRFYRRSSEYLARIDQ